MDNGGGLRRGPEGQTVLEEHEGWAVPWNHSGKVAFVAVSEA